MRIAIWGAGSFGEYVGKQILENEEIEIVYFIDKDRHGEELFGIKIISPQKFILESQIKIDILLVTFMNSIDIYNKLRKYIRIKIGFIKNYFFTQKLKLKKQILKDENIFWVDDKTKPLLPTLETNIVDFCNLNCKGCSHFSNLYQKGQMVTFESFKKDLLQIARNVYIYRFNMLGGEILLNSRLIEYIEYARDVLPMTDIWIITNGLLLLKQKDEFFRCCVEKNIGIDISEYEPTSLIIEDIIKLLEKNDVRYNIRNNKGDFGKNIDLSGSADKTKAMKNCRESKCHFFREGKLYKCPFSALGNKFFEHFNLNIELNEGNDLYNENLNWDELVNKLTNETIDACKYCGKEERFRWEISQHPNKEDWVVD